MTTVITGGKLSAFIDKLKGWRPNKSKTTEPSAPTEKAFYGKRISLQEALHVTHELVDYYEALKYGRALPKKPHPAIGYLLRCNAITHMHYTTQNLQLSGIAFKNWTITQDQVLYTWLYAHKFDRVKPLVTLSGTSIIFKDQE